MLQVTRGTCVLLPRQTAVLDLSRVARRGVSGSATVHKQTSQ